MLLKAGVTVAIITGRSSKVVVHRAAELGITEVFQKCHNKRLPFEILLKKYALADIEAAYVGDDIVDLPIMKRVGLSVAVADAADEVKGMACMTTSNRGGRGAVREVTDLILKAKGLWKDQLNEYLKT
jgi:3-deoxy-D-manno-octulosonate 8-phosphate phosphatase (KDO 8-P phosphatase)